MWPLLPFVILPIVEIALFIQVGGAIGLLPTLGLVILSSVLGVAVLRRRGATAARDVQRAMQEFRDPTAPMAHGALVMLAGLLMIVPGLFTSGVGLLLLIPGVRSLVLRRMGRRVGVSGVVYRQPIYQGNLIDEATVQQLQVGMSKQQVAAMLGTPSIEDPFHHDRWDYTSSVRRGRTAKTEVRNFVVHFENEAVTRWEGDYFANQDAELAKRSLRDFGPNLRKDKKDRR